MKRVQRSLFTPDVGRAESCLVAFQELEDSINYFFFFFDFHVRRVRADINDREYTYREKE